MPLDKMSPLSMLIAYVHGQVLAVLRVEGRGEGEGRRVAGKERHIGHIMSCL